MLPRYRRGRRGRRFGVTPDLPGPGAEPGAAAGLAGAVRHLLLCQDPAGFREGEVAWNTMLLSQYGLTSRMARRLRWTERDRDMIVRHLEATRRGRVLAAAQ